MPRDGPRQGCKIICATKYAKFILAREKTREEGILRKGWYPSGVIQENPQRGRRVDQRDRLDKTNN